MTNRHLRNDTQRHSFRFDKNIFGDVVGIYNTSNALVGAYRYDAWGNCTIIQDKSGIATANPFRYRGYYWDSKLSLYYLESRFYDPTIRRFISRDDTAYLDPETINGLNLYAYCLNNPVMYVDPSGNVPITALVIAGWGLLAIFGIISVNAIEYQFHPIENAMNMIGDGLEWFINSIATFFSDVGTSIANWWDNIRNGNASSIAEQLNFHGIYLAYKPKKRGVRVRGKSKKNAKEKARARGGGRPPIFHKDHGNGFGPHFHPNVPKGHPFQHDHYYYLVLLLLGLLNLENDA